MYVHSQKKTAHSMDIVNSALRNITQLMTDQLIKFFLVTVHQFIAHTNEKFTFAL
jgi:hypothetical protein